MNDLVTSLTTPAAATTAADDQTKKPVETPAAPALTIVPPVSSAETIAEDDLLAPPKPPLSPGETVAPAAANPIATAPAATAQPGETQPRKRGRPLGSKNQPRADFSDVANLVPVVNYGEMSCALFDMSTGLLTTTFGPEWQPTSADERKNVCTCLEVYLKTKQVQDIPPGLMLTIVAVAYAAPRLRAPSTQEKIKPAVLWSWNKVKAFFSRKPKFSIVQAPTNAQPPVIQ